MVDDRTSRVGEPHHLGTLIEGLAGCIVDRRAENLHLGRGINAHDLRVATAHEQTQEGKVGVGELTVGHIDQVREDVSLQVVYLDHRDVLC